MHQNSIWFLYHLVNIQTKNTKKESFKNVEYKKNEKSCKLRLIFPFSGTAVSENSLFHCCFVRVCVFIVLVFSWILAWVCTLCCFIIDLLWKSIHYFICYCFAMSTSAIWLSTFVLLIVLFSAIWLSTLIFCLSLLEPLSSHVSFQFSVGLAFLISFSCFLFYLGPSTCLSILVD